jgi:hypothetical protein
VDNGDKKEAVARQAPGVGGRKQASGRRRGRASGGYAQRDVDRSAEAGEKQGDGAPPARGVERRGNPWEGYPQESRVIHRPRRDYPQEDGGRGAGRAIREELPVAGAAAVGRGANGPPQEAKRKREASAAAYGTRARRALREPRAVADGESSAGVESESCRGRLASDCMQCLP